MISSTPPAARQTRSSTGWGRSPSQSEPQLPASLLQVVDAGLFGLIFLAPLVLGGRHDLGRLVVIVLSGVVAFAWNLRQAILPGESSSPKSLASVLAATAVLLVALQLVPLPKDMLQQISPRNTELIAGEVNFAVPPVRTLSLIAPETRKSLALVIAYALLLTTVIQRLTTAAEVQRLLKAIAVAGVAMAVLGLLQKFFSNGLFLWFYEIADRNTWHYVSGPFTNRNHFAHFLALALAPLLAWALLTLRKSGQPDVSQTSRYSRTRRTEQPVFLIAIQFVGLALVASAGLLTLSRGGAIALAVSAVVTLWFCQRARLLGTSSLLGLALLAVAALSLLSTKDYDRIAERLDIAANGSLAAADSESSRRDIWSANLDAIQAGWLTGAGTGSHASIYPLYMDSPHPVRFTHAENGYLQIATEGGLPAVLLLLGVFGVLAVSGYRALRYAPDSVALAYSGAAVAALTTSAVHSLFDFVWYIPACLTLALLLAAAVIRLAQLHTLQTQAFLPLSPSYWWGRTALVGVAGSWAIFTMWGPAQANLHWDKYRLASEARAVEVKKMLHTTDPRERNESQQALAMHDRLMFAQLQHVIRHEPHHAAAHLRLAKIHVRTFDSLQQSAENAIGSEGVRDAALASGFKSQQALYQWMKQAIGANVKHLIRAHAHIRWSLRLNPLQGEGYLLLSQLCYLNGHGAQEIAALTDQALRVRPYSGAVLFNVGRQQLLLGHHQQAQDLWVKAFAISGIQQQHILGYLAPQAPAAAFLQTFQPQWQVFPQVERAFRAAGRPADLPALAEYAAKLVSHDQDQTRSITEKEHLRLAKLQWDAGQGENAIATLRQAQSDFPYSYKIRRQWALDLFALQRFDESQPILQWCAIQEPRDNEVQSALEQIATTPLARHPLNTPR